MHDYDFPEYYSPEPDRPSRFTRFNIRVLSFAAAIMLVGAGFFMLGSYERNRLHREINTAHARALSELSGCVSEIYALLGRAAYITSPELAAGLAFDLSRQVAAAQSMLSQLPAQDANIRVFLAQAGDYIFKLAQRAICAGGVELTGEERANINMLADYAAGLAVQLAAVQDERGGAVADIIREPAAEAAPVLLSRGGEYKMLEGEVEVSMADARANAGKFKEVPASRLRSKGATESAYAPAFNFVFDNKFIQVTRHGGYVLNFFADRLLAEQAVDADDALIAAGEFLARNMPGAEFRAMSHAESGGVLFIDFAPMQDDIALLPDLIKIGVALDNGEIIFYGAGDYLRNHARRDLPDIIGEGEAARAVAQGLEIKGSRLVLLGCRYAGEILCYEFKCADGAGRAIAVYVNAETGRQALII